MSENSPRKQAILQLGDDMRSAIADARRVLKDEELTQVLESILREYFMARVYPR